MSEMTDAEAEAVDVAVVAYRDEGEWNVQELPGHALDSIESIAEELRRFPAETGALALISVDEDFALVVRVHGPDVELLLSDATAASDWTLAREAVDHLGLVVDEDEESEEPAGDLDLLADLGVDGSLLAEVMEDEELYPDEMLSDIAAQLGFGEQFDELAELDEE